jgi:hypothetical protein
MNKYEQLIESILNEDEAAAKALFHDIVVAKSREIYESLMDEEMGGNQAQGFVSDITNQDEQAQDMGLGEDDLEGGEIELGGDDMGGEEDFGGDDETFGDDGDMGGEEGEHEAIVGKMDELQAQLEELKSMLGGEEDGDMGGDDMGGEEDFGGDDMGGDEGESDFDMDGGEEETSGDDEMMEAGNPFAGSGKSGSGKSGSGMSGSGIKEAFGKSGSGVSGSGKSGSGKSGSGKTESIVRKTEAEIMKEYVDKIGEIYKQEPASGEGKTVGTGGDAPTVNSKSVGLSSGPDFGGDSNNIVKGGAEQNPDGKQFSKPKNVYSKGETTFSNEKFQNAPGANAGKTGFKSKVAGGHGAEKKSGPEGKTTDGSVPVAKKSVQVQNTGRK